ncbi:MAG: hypothetical protein ACD_15C00108G0010 [uncultured bacterium]|nr:MAG: hypothetical protein ACD_15C00108G0010 [uncultured bacterium]
MALDRKNFENILNWRIYVLVFLFFLIAGVIIFRFCFLQIVQYKQYQALAEGQHSIFRNLIPKRGEIFMKDRNDPYPLAVNRETKMAYAVPTEITDAAQASFAVAAALQLDAAELLEKFSKPGDMYEPIKHRLSDEETSNINNLKLEGIHLAEESYRYYPSSELAASIVGFVGWRDDSFGGRYGFEAFEDERLRGMEGSLFHKRDATGNWIGGRKREITQAKDGDDFILTLDHIVQYQAEKIIKNSIGKFEADSGSIIVMEPSTGKILAMANFPTFNPNEYSKVEDISVFRNTAISNAYESGSVFKTFTIAAGLDSGKITPETTYNDTGSVSEAGYTIKNSDLKSNGVQTMTQVLEKSLNTGVIHVEKLLGNKNFADYVKRFGFGEPTGIDLMGEARGNINNLKNLKSDIQFFTASFGQGVTVTPIQLASAYSAIANGGVLMKPQIIDKIQYADGTEEIIEPQEIHRVISQKASIETGKILQSVVQNGHGKRAGVPGYLVGGKTGTAQIVDSETGGYAEGKSVGSFAGFAPIDDPKFTIVVELDNPKNVEWAESSAAPAFGELMKFLLEYYNIEPTEEYTQEDLDRFNAAHTILQFSKDEQKDENSGANPVSQDQNSIIKKDAKKKKNDKR